MTYGPAPDREFASFAEVLEHARRAWDVVRESEELDDLPGESDRIELDGLHVAKQLWLQLALQAVPLLLVVAGAVG